MEDLPSRESLPARTAASPAAPSTAPSTASSPAVHSKPVPGSEPQAHAPSSEQFAAEGAATAEVPVAVPAATSANAPAKATVVETTPTAGVVTPAVEGKTLAGELAPASSEAQKAVEGTRAIKETSTGDKAPSAGFALAASQASSMAPPEPEPPAGQSPPFGRACWAAQRLLLGLSRAEAMQATRLTSQGLVVLRPRRRRQHGQASLRHPPRLFLVPRVPRSRCQGHWSRRR